MTGWMDESLDGKIATGATALARKRAAPLAGVQLVAPVVSVLGAGNVELPFTTE